ncbi:hypothetical protein B0A48_14556 [Cryoendolithus antarcticus]|uniref:Major facilitator superfamily (MFS) profile domain-containing protein n=1 Tax=Cryoendolithus antarcticus TaxID=1507870 RepID=A0A1V8SKU2_9PEZI|nr:hypothetical protein B0A48_14556 [Cryoendolithus antarcticus]
MPDEAIKGAVDASLYYEAATIADARTIEVGAPDDPPVEPPPDGGYGWVCCGAVSLLNGFTWGVAASTGTFYSHWLSDDYYPDATPFDYAMVGGLIFGCALLFSPMWTILTREVGRRPVMLTGCVVMSGGFIAASFATKVWQLILTQGCMVGVGIGAIFIPSVQVVPQWFLKRRSLAGGIASAGSGFGGLAFSLGTDAMIRHLSIAWALRITGLVAFVGNLVGTLLIRDRNASIKPPQLGFATHLLRRYDCLLLLFWGATNLLGYMVILYSVSSYATQVVHLSQAKAGILTAVLNLGTAFGRPASGLLADRYGRVEVSFALTFGCGVSVIALWIPASSYALLMVFAFVSGAILGVFWLSIGPLCAEIAGLKEVPSFLSLCWLAVVLPTTFGEAIGLYLRRPSLGRWNYLYCQVFAAVAYLVASVFLAELWRVRRVEKAESLRPESRKPMGRVRHWMYRYRP